MKSDRITWIFFIIVLTGIIGGIFHILRLHTVIQKPDSIPVISKPAGKTPLLMRKNEGKMKKDEGKRIKKDEIPNPKSILPEPVKFGELNILSFPSGATVYLDGIQQRKITPMTISNVKTGIHRIKLVKSNYQPFESRLEIEESATTYIKAELKLVLGSLFVHSNPVNATVHLNGEAKGVTPLTIPDLTPWQPYQLEISLFNHYDWSTNVFVEPGEEVKIEVNLNPKLEGFIYVTSIPPSSSVYLDDELIGKTPLRGFAVKPGKYNLKVMQEGYLPQTKGITILSDKSVFVNFELTMEKN